MMKRRIATVLAAVTGFILLGADAAYAADASVDTINNGYLRGTAWWTENGDTLQVCDEMADGAGVRGYVYQPKAGDQENGTVLIKASDSNATDGCVSVSKNISETITIGLKVCLYHDGLVDNCYAVIIPR